MTHGSAGDRIIIRSGRLGGHDRDGEVLEARGPGGTAPFLVRWSDDGHVSLVYPGSDAVIHDGSSRLPPSHPAGRWE